MTPDELRRTTRRYVDEVFNARNVAHANEALADAFVELTAPPPEAGPWKDGAIQRIRSFLDASDDLRAEILDIVTDGGRVGIRVRYTGTDSGGVVPGTNATGRRFDLEGMDIFAANDAGRFVEHYGIIDMRAAMEQLGFVPAAHA